MWDTHLEDCFFCPVWNMGCFYCVHLLFSMYFLLSVSVWLNLGNENTWIALKNRFFHIVEYVFERITSPVCGACWSFPLSYEAVTLPKKRLCCCNNGRYQLGRLLHVYFRSCDSGFLSMAQRSNLIQTLAGNIM